MRRTGHPAVVYSVQAWSAIGRLSKPEFALIQRAVFEAAAKLGAVEADEPLRYEVKAGAYLLSCVFEPRSGLCTVDRLDGTP